MSHQFEDGFFTIKPPWHGLGTVLPEAPADSKEAIRAANLDWRVEKQPLLTTEGVYVPNHYAVIRKKEGLRDSLGVVGNRYQPVQNIDAFNFFDQVIADGDATYDAAGSLKGGSIIWILAKLNGPLRITKDDHVEKYLLLYNSHDGSSAVTMQFTPIRVVCHNTLTMARELVNSAYSLSVRHTATVLYRMQSTAQYLGYVNDQFEHTGDAYRFLAGKKINTDQLEVYLQKLFPDPKGETKRNRNKATREKCIELFEVGQGTDVTGDNYWKAYNSVTEYVDHIRNRNNQEARVRSAWMGQGHRLKSKALETALAA
ncbi:MAG: DUF932 domain-containing protein [Deltaproteobacteria bacterium]|nr:DUF932 domain-containing protein [Deltaproteobacteria bacterium]